MTEVVGETAAMIAGMNPVLRPGGFVFCTIRDEAGFEGMNAVLASFRESEGLSIVLPVERARALKIEYGPEMRCITLEVYSSLEGVGLTAAVATALAAGGIACNMVSAFHHDHAFVPAERAAEALEILRGLQAARA